jgi:hypothetical protein
LRAQTAETATSLALPPAGKKRVSEKPLAFPRDFHYMRRSIAQSACFHWPLLDDIPAVGVPFPELRKEKSGVDYRRA